MKLKAIQLLSLVFLFLVTGVFWGTWLALAQSMDAFAISEYVHIGQVIIANLATTMRIIGPVCVFLIIVSLHLNPKKRSASFILGIASLLLLLSALLITVQILVPIDAEIKSVSDAPDVAKWKEIRVRWHFYHTMRTFLGLASFIGLAASVIWTQRQPSETIR